MVYMHRNPQLKKPVYAPAKIAGVPNQPRTPNRALRVDDDLWRDYGEACKAEGVSMSDDLRAHMTRKVKAWKRRKRGGSADQAPETR
jgi:hypothetical protein